MLPPEADPAAPLPNASSQPVSPSEPSPAVAAALGGHVYGFTFTGNAKEYFRIWIVNLFLSIITIGLYSPWAKVRKTRYIYANTWVADANLEYHGNPVAILKGRLIAVAALIAYNLGGHYLPKLGTAILIGLMVAAPWLVVRSMQFNAVNTSYRNLRFHFHGKYWEGLKIIAPFVLSPILVFVLPPIDPNSDPMSKTLWMSALLPVLPFLLFYPYVIGKLKRFQVANLAYGTQGFHIDLGIATFYGIYVIAGLLFVPGMFFVGISAVAVAFWKGAIFVPMFAYLLVIAIVFAYTRSRVTNKTISASRLGEARFVSEISFIKLGWMYFLNVFAIVLTCGLLVPWAVMRVARYRAECMRIESDGDLESFLADVSRPVGATGDQLGEFFDVDLSL
jgi:uncharacterized membrane protein YjgN (DUF898 family)